MDAVRVGAAVASGLSIACATCKKYWRARDAGVPGDRCLSVNSCASPLGGGTFHEYEGPISDWKPWCFVCGAKSTHALKHRYSKVLFGICSKHLRYANELHAENAVAKPDITVVRSGQVVPVEHLFRRHKKTLGESIAEAEAYFAEKRQRD